MKIVASTKLTKAQRAMEESRAYGNTSNTVFEEAETKPLEARTRRRCSLSAALTRAFAVVFTLV